jgi:hypothetical protein
LLAARDILSHAIKAGKRKVPEAFVIADEAGRKLDVVPLAAVLPPPQLASCPAYTRILPGVVMRSLP